MPYRYAVGRRPLILGIFLLAGAVVNVAVAWGILWKGDWRTVLPAMERRDGEVWPSDVPSHWPDTPQTFVRAEWFGTLRLSYSAQAFSDPADERFGFSTAPCWDW